jgi:hypothetical protein
MIDTQIKSATLEDVLSLAEYETRFSFEEQLERIAAEGWPMNAEILTDEGLDVILGIFPKNGTNLATMYMALFTAFTATTVGTNTSVADNYTEPTDSAYARVAVPSTDWGAPAAGTGGRKVTSAQKSFPAANANYGSAVNGYWFANQLSATGDKSIGASNFAEGAATPSAGDVLRVTADFQFNS